MGSEVYLATLGNDMNYTGFKYVILRWKGNEIAKAWDSTTWDLEIRIRIFAFVMFSTENLDFTRFNLSWNFLKVKIIDVCTAQDYKPIPIIICGQFRKLTHFFPFICSHLLSVKLLYEVARLYITSNTKRCINVETNILPFLPLLRWKNPCCLLSFN
ncbi:hypothetical protein GIB67_023365 [Kingdonia uniflora]|uniref:Uncharacterized protein n=1 Tax=Kingdonia uniflora TaxID=39325 RepID=A0A7J7LIK1_9MAGN|nr:hypothetical protein GIB67_023365 [Kingdonia uniflora]